MNVARSALAGLLVVLVAVLVPASVATRWADRELTDTDQYVADAGPLADDPAVQAAVADRITTALVRRVGRVSGGTSSEVTAQIRTLAEAAVASQTFADAWTAAQRSGHTALAEALTEGGPPAPLVVDLAPVVQSVEESLRSTGLLTADGAPTVQLQVALVDETDVARIQDRYDTLHRAATWLPILAVVALVLALLLGRSRRRVLVGAGLSVAVTMLLLVAAQVVGRSVFAQSAGELTLDGADAVYDALTAQLRHNALVGAAIAAAIGVLAWLAGLVTRRRRGAPEPV